MIPNLDDITLKEQISKGVVSVVNPATVSKALSIAGLDESEVNNFVEKLKQTS